MSKAKSETYTKSWAGTCSLTQARIDKYIQSYPTAYYGAWDSYMSQATSTVGTSAGHYLRGQLGGQTSAWQSF